MYSSNAANDPQYPSQEGEAALHASQPPKHDDDESHQVNPHTESELSEAQGLPPPIVVPVHFPRGHPPGTSTVHSTAYTDIVMTPPPGYTPTRDMVPALSSTDIMEGVSTVDPVTRATIIMHYRIRVSYGISLLFMALMVLCLIAIVITVLLMRFYFNVIWILGIFLVTIGCAGMFFDVFDILGHRRSLKVPRLLHMLDVVIGIIGIISLPTFQIISYFAKQVKGNK